MGREIREVPAGWEHPKNERGHYSPLYDASFDEVARKWLDNAIAWDNGTHKDLLTRPELKETCPFFWQWGGQCPDEDYYRPAWKDEERTHVQMYETVSEGTPVSPVFATRGGLADWLVTQGHTRHAADAFVKSGWAPSAMISNGRMASGVDIYDLANG